MAERPEERLGGHLVAGNQEDSRPEVHLLERQMAEELHQREEDFLCRKYN